MASFGLTGLATMGANLARNVARHDIPVVVHNRTAARTDDFVRDFGHEGPIEGRERTADFVAALERPRTVVVMVKAGAPVDAVIDELAPLLEPGDTIVDGGNSHHRDTERREAALRAGGSPWKEPMDMGAMYGRSFRDPDGHVWELTWMDVEAFLAQGPGETAGAAG